MKLVDANPENIKEAAAIIKSGGLVAFPTETVYGLGADGLNPIAVAKIFEAKKRPAFNPLILHIYNIDWLKKLTVFNDERVYQLINKFWPGPLTLVLPKTDVVPDIVTSGNETVAVRMPDHPVALKLIEESGTPIAAPSANKFGHLSPTDAQHVAKSLGDKVDLILDGGKCTVGVESTILEVNESGIILLRPGGLSKEEIENEIDEIKLKKKSAAKPNSPGQLPFHYSPNIPLFFLTVEKLHKYRNHKIGVLFFDTLHSDYEFTSGKVLSSTGNLKEAAANLFKYLHEFEKENVEVILVEPVPETGLGLAIMDRLRKASKKYEN
ncbi:MAG: L-threonylcarbamoyladenylate synthase [bacterium]